MGEEPSFSVNQKMNKKDCRLILRQFIENFKPFKVLVFGDFMLDHYIWGNVTRISPEAPIPILQTEEEQFQLGGAGCCLMNLLRLGCQATPMGIYGKDEAGEKLLGILKQQKVNISNFHALENYQTVVKCRISTRRQQLLRLDYEKRFVLDKKKSAHFWANLNLKNFQILIISDYLKGSCNPTLVTKLIAEARKNNLFVVVDPAKTVDFSIYKRAHCIKPNRVEAEIFCKAKLRSQTDYLKAAAFIQKKTAIDTIVLSLDKEGLLIYQNPKEYQFFSVQQESVFDVTGAGDLVTSIVAIILGGKQSIEMTGNLANLAAAVAIKKLGTYSPTWDEIKAEIDRKYPLLRNEN